MKKTGLKKPIGEEMKIRSLIATSLCALFLVGCTCGCETLLGSNTNPAIQTLHRRIADVEANKSENKLIVRQAQEETISRAVNEGRLEAARLGFGDYVVDAETGKPVFVWKTHLLGHEGTNRTSRSPQPELLTPEGE